MVIGSVLRGLACGRARWTDTAAGENTATAELPATGPPVPKIVAPQDVRIVPGSPVIPDIRFSPAIRAAKSLRGAARTVRTGPLSTTLPASTTMTVFAIARASSRSWVTITAVR